MRSGRRNTDTLHDVEQGRPKVRPVSRSSPPNSRSAISGPKVSPTFTGKQLNGKKTKSNFKPSIKIGVVYRIFKRSQTTRRRRATSAFLVLLMLASAVYGFQAYSLNKDLKEQLAVLGAADTSDSPARFDSNNPPSEEKPDDDQVAAYVVAPDKPRYLVIPLFNIKARVLELGLTPEGAVDVPGGIYDVGWFNESSSINDQSGAMFVAGHVSGPTQDGVFYSLNKLVGGDEVYIEKGNGDKVFFDVFESNLYGVDTVDMKRALSSSAIHKNTLNLNLMTCSGGFDVESQSFDERLLVSLVERK